MPHDGGCTQINLGPDPIVAKGVKVTRERRGTYQQTKRQETPAAIAPLPLPLTTAKPIENMNNKETIVRYTKNDCLSVRTFLNEVQLGSSCRATYSIPASASTSWAWHARIKAVSIFT